MERIDHSEFHTSILDITHYLKKTDRLFSLNGRAHPIFFIEVIGLIKAKCGLVSKKKKNPNETCNFTANKRIFLFLFGCYFTYVYS